MAIINGYSTSLGLGDQMSPVLKTILKSAQMTFDCMKDLANEGDKGLDSKAFKDAEKAINEANNALIKFEGTARSGKMDAEKAKAFQDTESAIQSADRALELFHTKMSKVMTGDVKLDKQYKITEASISQASDALSKFESALAKNRNATGIKPKAYKDVERAISKAETALSTFDLNAKKAKESGEAISSKAYAEVERSIRAAEDALTKFESNTQKTKKSSEETGTSFKGWEKAIIVANQALNLIKSTLGSITSKFESAFGRADTMEQFHRSATAIIGDAKVAEAALEALRQTTLGTAYGLDTAAKATQDFTTRGMGIGKATEQVRIWGDAVAFYGKGSDEQFSTVMDALAKMRTKGKVDMQQMNRLFDAGIDAVGMYAQAVGSTSAAVQADLSAGKIGADQFLDTVSKAMDEGANGVLQISGAAKEAGNNWANTFSKFEAALTRGRLNLVETLEAGLAQGDLPGLKDMIMSTGRIMEQLYGMIGQGLAALAPVFGAIGSALQFVQEHMDFFGPVIMALGVALAGLTVVVIAYTIAQWAMNSAILANPITWIVIGVMLLIAVIIGVINWIRKAWQTNAEFKIRILTTWNSILNFFDQIPIFFTRIGYGIADAFDMAKVMVLSIMESMANRVIDIINGMISAVNKIPGVAIDPLQHLSFASSAALEAEAKRAAREEKLDQKELAAAEKAAERAAKINEDAIRAEAEAAKATGNEDYADILSDHMDSDMTIDGGDLDSVGKIKSDVSIDEDDIKLLKDMASKEYALSFAQITPQMTVSFGDVRETADVNSIISVIEEMTVEALQSKLIGGVA